MGYNNEKASLNQFSALYEYCQKKVISQIKTVLIKADFDENAPIEQELPFVYESKNKEDLIPVVSFDGGLATIFPGELAETKLIKVAGACPPKWQDSFIGLRDEMFHVLSGLLKWPEGAELSEEEMIQKTIDQALEVDSILETLDHLGLSADQFKDSMIGHLKYKQGNQVEDCFREILEWCLIINFTYRQKQNSKIDFKNPIPYIIVKDGSLYPFGKTVGDLMSAEIEKFLNSGICPIVGMVKSSRFVAKDSSYRKAINKYLKKIKGNTFFKIPKKLEMIIDSRENFYERYFFSILSGNSVYEIQIPKVNFQKKKQYAESIMDVLNAQITFNFGGSISTNSYAHQLASLSEAESRFLTDKIKSDLFKEVKKEGNK